MWMNCIVMLFFDKKEIHYELYFKNILIKIFSNKKNGTNKYIYLFKPVIKLYFWYKNIKEEDLDFSKIFNNVILLWLITNNKSIVSNLSSKLHKGIRYYNYVLYTYIDNIYLLFNFLNEILLPIIQKNSKKIHYKNKYKHLYSFSDFGSFTNLRLSSNLYLNSVHNKLYIYFNLNKHLNFDLNVYLNCLKF